MHLPVTKFFNTKITRVDPQLRRLCPLRACRYGARDAGLCEVDDLSGLLRRPYYLDQRVPGSAVITLVCKQTDQEAIALAGGQRPTPILQEPRSMPSAGVPPWYQNRSLMYRGLATRATATRDRRPHQLGYQRVVYQSTTVNSCQGPPPPGEEADADERTLASSDERHYGSRSV